MNTRLVTPDNTLSVSGFETAVEYFRRMLVLELEVPENVKSVLRSALEHQQNNAGVTDAG